MQISGLVRSSFSSPHLLSVPTLGPKSHVETGYYVALFEFAQGSSPKILWENQSKSVLNRDSLLLYVINTPTDLTFNEYKPEPTIIKSEFSGIYFIAVYISIADYEARGFSRQVVLLIGHPLPKMINFVFQHSLQTFVSFATKLQDNASERFPREISKYTSDLRKTIAKYPESECLLQTKVNELERTLKAAGIEENTATEADSACDLKPEYFTRINNELRPIKKLTSFSDIEPRILNFVNSLPTNSLQCNARLRTNQSIVSLVDASFSTPTQKFMNIIQNKKIFDTLFALFSGKTLYVAGTENHNETRVLAERLSVLSPFDESFPVVDISSKSSKKDLYPQIVLCLAFDAESDPRASCLDIDADTYTGIKCPQDSIVMKELSKISTSHSLNVLLMLLGNETKKIGGRFVRKTLEMSSRAQQTKDRMMSQMMSIGFSLSDQPLLRYFSHVVAENPAINSSSVECFL